MTTVMMLAIYGLAYTARHLNGPFNIIGLIRNRAISFHIFFYDLLTCPWCVGTYAGLFVYLLGFDEFSIGAMILWAFAGSVIVALGDRVIELLEQLVS